MHAPSMKLRQPSLGTKAAIFLPFLISCTRAHFLMAELGCLASMPLRSGQSSQYPADTVYAASVRCAAERAHIFSSTMPLACEAPWKGFFHSLPR